MIAGVGLSMTLLNIIGLSILIGTNCAQETLCSQAFGAGELVRCGELLNRGRVIIIVLYIPMAFTFTFTKQLLIMLWQNPDVANYAHQYAISCVIGLLF